MIDIRELTFTYQGESKPALREISLSVPDGAFVGVIGFVDLIAPHVVRRIFGSNHRIVVPVSALFGGSFMVLADLVARTIVSPRELAVGAVTALIGAPFFAYVYFVRRRRERRA